MVNPNTRPEKVIDKNGKLTTVHKKIDSAEPSQGRVASTPVPQVSVAAPKKSPAEQLADKIVKGSHWYTLHYVDYDDQLQSEQINQYLSGDTENLSNEIYDSFADHLYDSAEQFAKDEAKEAGLDWDDLDWDEQSELINAVRESENPQSDIVEDLVRNTPKQLLRHDITSAEDIMNTWITDENGHPDREKIAETAYGHLADPEVRKNALAGELNRLGISTEGANEEALNSLISEGPDGWHDGVKLSLIWYDDIDNSRACAGDDVRDLTFSDKVNVLLLDTWSGSGYEASFEIDNFTVKPTYDNPVFVDSSSKERGYGWDDTAGVVKSYYDNAPKPGEWHRG